MRFVEPIISSQVEAHPARFASYIWRGPQGQLIDSDGLERYEKTVNGMDVILVILNPTLADMGPYPVEVLQPIIWSKNILTDSGESWQPCNTNSNSTCEERSESVSEITYLVMRQKAKVRVFSNKPEEEKFYRSGHELGYNISCSVEGFEINRTSASVYFRPCISYDNCQV